MRQRVKQKFPDESASYSGGFDPTTSSESMSRLAQTIALTKWVIKTYHPQSIADLSIGNGEVTNELIKEFPSLTYRLGDISQLNINKAIDKHGYTGENITYSYNDIIKELSTNFPSNVDLFISSETLEHLDNPDLALQLINTKSKYLVLTTPEDENPVDRLHYWVWGANDIEKMLKDAGFIPLVYQKIDNSRNKHFSNLCSYQMWFCLSKEDN